MSADLQAALDAASKEPLTVTFFKDERWPGFVIQLRDRDGEVVRQFPAEKVLNLRGIMDELAGMVVDEMT